MQIEDLPRRRIISRDKFYRSDLCIWQGEHLITKHLLYFLLPCELHSFHLKSQTPNSFSLFPYDICTSFCLSLQFPCLLRCPIYTLINFSPVNLSHVSLILHPARRILEKDKNSCSLTVQKCV